MKPANSGNAVASAPKNTDGRPTKPLRLGERLVAEGFITPDELRVALMEHRISGKRLGEVIVSLGFMDEQTAKRVIGEITGFKYIDLQTVVPDPVALQTIDEDFARAYMVLPLSYQDDLLRIAMVDPDNVILLDKIKRHVGRVDLRVEPFVASKKDIQEALDKYYGYTLSIDGILDELETGEVDIQLLAHEESYAHPVVRLVNAILTDAVKNGASDIHFEPEEFYVRIRYRIDGILKQIRLIHKTFWSGISVRLKVIADLDLTDSRKPQDGRMELFVHGRRIFFRVSSLPTLYGENFVLRILDRDKGIVPLDNLGLDEKSLSDLRIMISRPAGILLVTGPTGSGKTTTLYSILNEKNEVSTNIMTLEDPVEYPMELIRQTQVNEEAGMTFASGVRALLRQDPDVILIGEVRDGETAEMAFRAAMTGHQVFATLHTNSAIGAIPRLIDIGVPPSIMAGNIIGIVAQRLARRLCKHCKQPYTPEPHEKVLLEIKDDSTVLYRATGCEHCENSGYKGRLAILETLKITKEIDDLILRQSEWQEIESLAKKQGFKTLLDTALYWVLKGETTLEEVARVIDMSPLLDRKG